MKDNSRSKDVVIDGKKHSQPDKAKHFRDKYYFCPSPNFYTSRNLQGIKAEYSSEIRYDEER